MNPALLGILDRALTYSAWVFLGALLLFLLFASFSLRRRQRKLSDFYSPEASADRRLGSRRSPGPRTYPWRVSISALLLALLCGAVFFVLFVFTPLPFFDNFAASEVWQITPLRLTAVSFNRTYEGFSAEGEVWNQSTEPMADLKARVQVIGLDDQPLDTVDTAVEPSPLPAGTAGQFSLRYEKNSPFLKGFLVSFVDGAGQAVTHVSGFDVR